MTRTRLTGRARTYPILFVALALLALPSSSWAALDANMYIVGATQGSIQGEVIQAGREGSIQVVGYGYNLSADYDQATGLGSGQRQHRPIRVVKHIDTTSPLLFNALVNNENLTSVTIRFWRPGPGGVEQQYYTVTLTNARIVGITPTHSSAAEDAAVPATETISFTFQTIEFETIGGAVGTDTWSNP
jgi:type VI secretion system secreted protein Hcp